MHKTAVAAAREFLESEAPARNVEALEGWLKQARLLRSDLKAYTGGARTLSDRDYLEAGGLLDVIEGNIPTAELILDRVRNELPAAQETVLASGDELEMDVKGTVEKAAAQYALETLGMPKMDRIMSSFRSYDYQVDSQLPEGFKDFPKQKFAEKLEEYLALDPETLKQKIAAEVPDYVDLFHEGNPEPPVDHIPSMFEKDPESRPDPVKEDIDGIFEDRQDEERRARGIPKNQEATAGLKTADKDPEKVDFAGSGPGTDAAPKAEDAIDKEFEKNLESESGGQPRGPNRRKRDDVPAWSTPKNKLTAALKLADQYENMTAEEALAMVDSVQSVLAGEIPEQFKKHIKKKDDDDGADDKDDFGNSKRKAEDKDRGDDDEGNPFAKKDDDKDKD